MTTEIDVPTLTKKEAAQFKKIKSVIRRWCDDRFAIGRNLAIILDQKLYREEFDSFEAFVHSEYSWTRDAAYKLIEAAKTKDSLPQSVYKIIQNPSQALALSNVPEEEREEVLKEVAAAGEVTAAAIKEHAEKPAPKKREPKVECDETGEPIPKDLLENWNRAQEIGADLCSKISFLKCCIETGLQADPIFSELTNQTVVDLKNAHYSSKCIKPHALCPACHKDTRKKCKLCKTRGFISKHSWDNHVSDELKAGRK